MKNVFNRWTWYVEEGTEPTLNGFSNFCGVGNGYAYNDEGELQVFTPDGALRYFELAE